MRPTDQGIVLDSVRLARVPRTQSRVGSVLQKFRRAREIRHRLPDGKTVVR